MATSSHRTAMSSLSAAMKQYVQQAAEDDVVCAFGPDYFHGARTGACVGSLFSATLCWYTFRLLKEDQREVDFLAGLKHGQRNPHFSTWTLLRGLRTQPMLTTGCIALATTSAMKCIKCYLANQRCREFFTDDVQFHMISELSETDLDAAAFLSTVLHNANGCGVGARNALSTLREDRSEDQPSMSPAPTASASTSTVNGLLHTHSSRLDSKEFTLTHRAPTYYDGVAVAFLGSVLDCYLPQKPVQKYYNMRVGTW
ncbi:conserved hypothetical protein [Leishmania major strain Friedlin]|uniref:Uncharacterized protein n=1 Tax=Leishmania major TaxID=5664 RepID=Q4Q1V5_LEIMA|nr:conserved hypothetical protein [Leishmania major strain Friedlin]CAG9583639.1 hypothetical_protein_-_conserved [Leishmania major strain Friedlin]CAJ09074.1 conserved hypothetical protein [Leishmania major strain Friedlin]|eukprot:XP_001686693.1 conserved hypothetical protein [Leishmania major strain Friedlin]